MINTNIATKTVPPVLTQVLAKRFMNESVLGKLFNKLSGWLNHFNRKNSWILQVDKTWLFEKFIAAKIFIRSKSVILE
ncbi:hypothetical protein BH11BAC3_BH11BAC3_23390 [soil metagenome]